MSGAQLLHRYRILGAALAGSAAIHAAVMVSVPAQSEPIDDPSGVAYSATIDPDARIAEPAAAPAARPAPPRRAHARPAVPLLPAEPLLDPIAPETLASALAEALP